MDGESAMVSSWAVGGVNWGSDHFPISIKLGAAPTLMEETGAKTRIYSASKISWDDFSDTFEMKVCEDEILAQLDTAVTVKYSRFVELIYESLNNAMPKVKSRINRNGDRG